jgi:hypothetical protein
MLKLATPLMNELLRQPESGMGYQLVDAATVSGETKRAVAYNAELLLFEDEPRDLLTKKSYSELVRVAENSSDKIKSLRLRRRPRAATAGLVKESDAITAPKSPAAADAPILKTLIDEVFKRFSAYENDRRVQADKSLSPGTYATTETDAKHVKTGKQAVARYALPNPQPASYVFTIKPAQGTPIQRGIVQPAYGQPGGGVEVIFASGTQSNTVTGPVKIPDQ